VQNGRILIYPHTSQVTIASSASNSNTKLKPYTFGQKLQSHECCPNCAINVYLKKHKFSATEFKKWEGDRDQKEWEEECPVNLRCFNGVEWDKVKIGRESAENLEPTYVVG
jgi:hypothetical protein